MAQSAAKGRSEAQSFADLVKEAPRAGEAETVTLTGTLSRSDKEGHFVLAVEGGQSVELPIDAVKRHSVVSEAGGVKTVQITVASSLVSQVTTVPSLDQITTLKELTKDPIQDVTRKELIKDPVQDMTFKETVADQRFNFPFDAPFVLATPHHAPEAAVAAQEAGVAAGAVKALAQEATLTKSAVADTHITRKEVTTDPLADWITRKEVTSDHLTDPITIWEGGPNTLVEQPGGGTLVEQPGGGGGFGFPGF